jgi:hypothetical protein
MDPYLEAPANWEACHARLIFQLGSVLQEVLPLDYSAEFDQRVSLVVGGRDIVPDVAVVRGGDSGGEVTAQPSRQPDPAILVVAQPEEQRERFIEILHLPERRLVAVLELSSPTNKSDPRGKAAYHKKQQGVLASNAHLIEIDLPRAGGHWAAGPEHLAARHQPYDYLVCVSRAGKRDVYECHFRTVRDPLPVIAVPLLPPDADATLNIQEAFDRAYDQGRYARWVDYRRSPVPPLREEDREWSLLRLREKGYLHPE